MTPFQIFASALTLAASCAALASPTKLRLGPQGEILGWLMAGPFPNVGALQMKGTGFATDYLGGERSATAVEGRDIPMIDAERQTDATLTNKRKGSWQLGIGSPKAGIDLGRLLNGSKPAVAYLYAEIESPTERDAKLLFGSDDGAKVWLNGESLFSKQVARGLRRDEDSVPIHLRKGRNRLMFKIEQGDGDWGLLARIAGNGSGDLTEVLDLLPSPEDNKWVRRVVGKPGSLDLASAHDYQEIAERAGLWITHFRSEAAGSEKLEQLLADEAARVKSDFDSADELSSVLISANRSLRAQYDLARAPLLAKTQRGEPLVDTTVAGEDYVRVMPGGRYFVHADGKAIIPIGYNHNPDWQEFNEANPLHDAYEPDRPDKYMAHLKESGVNVIRLMIETPPSGNLEDPIGTFLPEHVRWIDTVFLAARKHGIKLIVTPWDTFWMNRRWDTTPYNPDNGGLVHKRIEFITSPAVRVQQKKRLKFLIDHWGNTGTVFSWELLNEADIWWGANARQLTDWTDDMADYVRTYEKKRWGRNHMLSVSFAEPMPKGDMAKLAFHSDKLDYATTHLYIGVSKAPTEAIGPALAIQEGVRYAMAQISDNRPYMDTENGPIDKWIDSAVLDNEVFHNMTWAHLTSGAAGSSFRWPYRHPHHLTEGMLLHLKHLSSFVAEVDWAAFGGSRVPIDLQGRDVFGFATSKSAMVWSPGAEPVSVKWNGPKEVKCRRFDTLTGKWLDEVTLQQEDGLYHLPSSNRPSTAFVLSASR